MRLQLISNGIHITIIMDECNALKKPFLNLYYMEYISQNLEVEITA
jgi:hypothetical protein